MQRGNNISITLQKLQSDCSSDCVTPFYSFLDHLSSSEAIVGRASDQEMNSIIDAFWSGALQTPPLLKPSIEDIDTIPAFLSETPYFYCNKDKKIQELQIATHRVGTIIRKLGCPKVNADVVHTLYLQMFIDKDKFQEDRKVRNRGSGSTNKKYMIETLDEANILSSSRMKHVYSVPIVSPYYSNWNKSGRVRDSTESSNKGVKRYDKLNNAIVLDFLVNALKPENVSAWVDSPSPVMSSAGKVELLARVLSSFMLGKYQKLRDGDDDRLTWYNDCHVLAEVKA